MSTENPRITFAARHDGSLRIQVRYPNGFGASVIPCDMGGSELAVLQFSDPSTDDYIIVGEPESCLTRRDVLRRLDAIQAK